MTSPSQKIEIKKPINIARKTRIERSLFFMTLIVLPGLQEAAARKFDEGLETTRVEVSEALAKC